jgi:alkylation response protein AidB-like acyl-CoA dehydrogenase
MTIRADTEAFIAEQWNEDLTLREWWALLADAGLAFPSWPAGLGGRGAPRFDASEAARALGRANVIGAPPGLGTQMGGPVLLDYGTDEQKGRFVRALAIGEEGWCQLFSEPGAGSDLASMSTKAERDGDEWVVTGQKVWTSGATGSTRGMLVARTDWDVPKHRGLSYFIIDLRQPGVTIRPLRQMNHKAHFSEVFFDEARVPDTNRIGDINGGWAVALATLAYERSGLSESDTRGSIRPNAGVEGGMLDRTVGSILAEARSAKAAPNEAAAGAFTVLRDNAEALHRTGDAVTRQRLATTYARERIALASQGRTAAAAKAGRAPGAESSTAKLFWTEGLRLTRDLSLALLGPGGMLLGDDALDSGQAATFALSVPSASIAGGSDEVQRNIIGERALGLPKEPSVDADVPFREVRRS